MAQRGVPVADTDQYVSLSRARWLCAAGRARMLPNGSVSIRGSVHAEPSARGQYDPADARGFVRWTKRSGRADEPWIPRAVQGIRMMGAALGEEHALP